MTFVIKILYFCKKIKKCLQNSKMYDIMYKDEFTALKIHWR